MEDRPHLSPILASIACFVALGLGDFLVGGRAIEADVVLAVVGLAVGAGFVHGLIWAILLRLGARLPIGGNIGLSAGLFAVAGLWLVDALNAVGKLDGPHRGLAFAVFGAAAAVTVGGAIAFCALVGLRRGHARLAPAFVALGLLAMAGLAAADRLLFPGNYRAFHTFLAALALVAGTLALSALPVAPRARWSAWVVGAAFAALPFLVLLPARTAALSAVVSRPFSGLPLAALRALTDFDQDGFSSLLAGGDCAPFDARVNPGATEVPGNGLDDNCQFGDAPVYEEVRAEAVPVPAAPSPTSVLLITIDTLRPDRMSLFGAPRPTTPNLAAWAKAGARAYVLATTSGGFTTIALPSIMRGIYPRRIGWDPIVQTNRLRLYPPDAPLELVPGERPMFVYGKARPSESFKPLAWWLKRRGMATAAVVDDGVAGFLAPQWGFAEGFDRYVEIPYDEALPDQDAAVADRAVEQLAQLQGAGTPYFLWVHFYGPHAPDSPHPEFGFPDDLGGRYDAEVAYTDQQVGRILAALSGPVLTIVASDHGEVFTPQGRYHGRTLGEDALRVPLLLRGPGVVPGRADEPVSLVDLAPTILAATGTPAPPGLDGVDLLSTPADALAARLVLAETWYWDGQGALGLDRLAVFSRTHRLESDRLTNTLALFRRDAPEPLEAPDEAVMSALSKRLFQHFEAAGGVVRLNAEEAP